MIEKLLVVPDSHSHPDYDGKRFVALSKLIMAERPDCIVCLGDFWDMHSLSVYDVGKTTAEGRRYQEDVAVGNLHMGFLVEGIRSHNKEQADKRKKQYKPRMEFLMGNHEYRIKRAANEAPHLYGKLSYNDLYLDDWNVTPFKVPLHIEGISFCHYFPSGGMGRPISGENHAKSLLKKLYTSCVVGHSHLLDFAQQTKATGEKMFALVAGCYGHLDHDEGWSTGTDQMWWNGITILHGVENGHFRELQFISQERIEAKYEV